jgi:SPP1 gp7 family putative phage head morphogenesis protein
MPKKTKAKLTKKKSNYAKVRKAGFIFVGEPVKIEVVENQLYRYSIMLQLQKLDKKAKNLSLKILRENENIQYAASQIRILFNNIDNSEIANKIKNQTIAHLERLDKLNTKNVNSSIKDLTGKFISITPSESSKAILKSAIDDALLYYDKLQDDIVDKYRKLLNNSVVSGVDNNTIKKSVMEAVGYNEKKAAMAAENIGRYMTSALTNQRMKNAGINKFKWMHSSAGKVPRQLHVDYDGQIFSFDDPPIIDEKTGQAGLPGQLINCRCRAIPVIEIEGEQDEEGN